MKFTKNHIHQVIIVDCFVKSMRQPHHVLLIRLNIWFLCSQHALSTANANSKSSAYSFEAIYNKVSHQTKPFTDSSCIQ